MHSFLLIYFNDDEQQACLKHVEAHYWNKSIENSASCWFMLYGYITMHRQQNIKIKKSFWVYLEQFLKFR
jgi:hypothetical protein